MADVTFVGLGSMGTAMARRLMAAGHTVHVWNRSRGPVDELVAEGAIAIEDPDEIFATGPVFSMLANDNAVASVFSARVLGAAPPASMHVNMATVGLDAADAQADVHAAAGIGYLAAPVLGRPNVAAAGQLNIVASGDQKSIEDVRPFLEAMGKRVWVVGNAARDANVVKIAVNFNLIHAIQALAESETLVEAYGIDPSTFVDILTDVAFTGSAYQGYGKLIAEQDYTPHFSVTLGAKDLALAARAAEQRHIALPSVPTLQRVYAATLARPELADLDWSATAEITRKQHEH
jgi:3-hydroxyisobutyrate dehydrogenase-like beta-hydroxyacid dehydrogenase